MKSSTTRTHIIHACIASMFLATVTMGDDDATAFQILGLHEFRGFGFQKAPADSITDFTIAFLFIDLIKNKYEIKEDEDTPGEYTLDPETSCTLRLIYADLALPDLYKKLIQAFKEINIGSDSYDKDKIKTFLELARENKVQIKNPDSTFSFINAQPEGTKGSETITFKQDGEGIKIDEFVLKLEIKFSVVADKFPEITLLSLEREGYSKVGGDDKLEVTSDNSDHYYALEGELYEYIRNPKSYVKKAGKGEDSRNKGGKGDQGDKGDKGDDGAGSKDGQPVSSVLIIVIAISVLVGIVGTLWFLERKMTAQKKNNKMAARQVRN